MREGAIKPRLQTRLQTHAANAASSHRVWTIFSTSCRKANAELRHLLRLLLQPDGVRRHALRPLRAGRCGATTHQLCSSRRRADAPSHAKRESVIVNAFAFFGLGLGLALFLGMVAINVLYLNKALWFFLTATVVFLVASRIFAGIIGGVIGDEIGYQYGHKKLAEDWRKHVAEREGSRRET